jgi:hypothetical protein
MFGTTSLILPKNHELGAVPNGLNTNEKKHDAFLNGLNDEI